MMIITLGCELMDLLADCDLSWKASSSAPPPHHSMTRTLLKDTDLNRYPGGQSADAIYVHIVSVKLRMRISPMKMASVRYVYCNTYDVV